MRILGVSCDYHDAAACLVEDGAIVAAAQEERFTRKKHDPSLPKRALRYCLAEASSPRIDALAFYDKPLLKFHRILETSLATAPRGLGHLVRSLPLWLRDKLWIEPRITDALEACGAQGEPKVFFPSHHLSHAASAFYPSPFQEAAVLTVDGVGEWETATIGLGSGARLELLEELTFPHSLGLLYSAMTAFAGFKVNSGEYKLMGLAPYGEGRYTRRILDHLIDLKPDGSFRLDMSYFAFLTDLSMTSRRFEALFDGPPRAPESTITRREVDLARSIQEVTEEVVLRAARHAREVTGARALCLAGGVALNCVANGRLLREGVFDELWVQPAAGDAGGALGAALAVWHGPLEGPREADGQRDTMRGSLLGPEFSAEQIREFLDARGYPYTEPGEERWPRAVAELIAAEHVVGLFQGRMEFGPRALGNRSIVGDPRSPRMQSVMNVKIKKRESFRPFAPSCLEERLGDYFELDRPSPYMLLVAQVAEGHRLAQEGDPGQLDLMERLALPRSDLPAITHVDGSARVQTVSAETNPRYHRLLRAFEEITGCAVLVNTSFNVRGEPIVCTPEDAYDCFMDTEMDDLSLGPFLLNRADQPRPPRARRRAFEQD